MTKTYNLAGTAYWAKVLGEPEENYRGDGNEWSIDVTPDQRGLDLIRRIGLGDKLRNKDDDREEFITFRRRELKKDGEPNDHIEVVDADGNPWDDKKAIGNGSKVKIKFSVFHMPAKGKFKEITKPVIYKITVAELVEYVKKERPKKDAVAPVKKKPASKKEAWEEPEGEED
jgi:hypothetical protein